MANEDLERLRRLIVKLAVFLQHFRCLPGRYSVRLLPLKTETAKSDGLFRWCVLGLALSF